MIKYYIVLSLLCLAGCYFIELLAIKLLLAWTGLSLLLVSAAYIIDYPQLFRKTQDGRIPIYIRWLFIPFLLGSQFYNYYARKNDSVPNIQQIDDQLFLATRLFPKDVQILQENGVTAVLDVTAEFDGLDWSAYQYELDYLNIPVLDHTSPKPEQLNLALNWIDQHLQDGEKVVVHCALGRGRSVFTLAAYLLARDNTLSIMDAMNQIQSIRTTARLNKKQLKTLTKIKEGGSLSLPPKIALIANPVAGGGKWPANKVDILSRLNEHYRVTIYETTPQISALTLAKEAANAGHNMLVACGGDGTVCEVAEAVLNSKKVVAVIPLGTANALSQVCFGLTSKLSPIHRACDHIIESHFTKVDTARCNDNLMLLVAAIGFESQMIEHADRKEKDEGGQLAYLQGLWQAIGQNKSIVVDVYFDQDSVVQIETPSLVIANSAPKTTVLAHGGDKPDITDGQLDVTWLTPSETAEQHIWTMAEMVMGSTERKSVSENISHKKVSKIHIILPKESPYVIDGEVYNAKEITITNQPESLNLVVNKTLFSDSSVFNTDKRH